nr:unnamed protein product [Callosobruchus analis]
MSVTNASTISYYTAYRNKTKGCHRN